MIRGSTPLHTFTLPFVPPAGSEYRIVYAQGGTVVLERTTESITANGSKLTLRLTAEETLLFDCKAYWEPVEIQVGVRTPAGDVLWSDIVTTTVSCCLREDGKV